MAFSHGSKARVLLNGYDMSSFVSNASFAGSVETADVSTLGATGKQHIPGLNDATFTLDGVFDGLAGNEDDIMTQALTGGASDGILYLPQGYTTVGQPAWGFDSYATAYAPSTPIGDAAKWTSTFQSIMGFERGLLHHPYQAEVAGGQSAGIDNTVVSTANGGVGYLQVSAGASLLVKIQDSADNATFADLLAFTVTSARAYQRVLYAGTVRRYTRCLWTGTGTFAASFVRK